MASTVFNRPPTSWRCLLLACLLAAARDTTPALAAPPAASLAADAREAPPAPARRALILVGLPGDAEHEVLFARTSEQWRRWLTQRLGFPAENVVVLFGQRGGEPENQPATKENLQQTLASWKERSAPNDAFWFFYLGHGHYDGERAWLHLPGPDVNDRELATLLEGSRGGEEVIWLTQAASGWFVPSLARPGRIVVTATEDDREFNETEFPHVLADVTEGDPKALDANEDQRVSLAELFLAVSDAVAATFEMSELAPTEHAQLDDDGDGRGTEAAEVRETLQEPQTTPGEVAPELPRALRRDGATAAKLLLPWTPHEEPSLTKE